VKVLLSYRPLSYVHSDTSEPQPLTPSHFLVGGRLTSLPLCLTHLPSPMQAGRRWLWNTWKRDYWMNMKSAHRCKTSRPTVLTVGVLIGGNNMPGQTWKMGRIMELFPGRDGL